MRLALSALFTFALIGGLSLLAHAAMCLSARLTWTGLALIGGAMCALHFLPSILQGIT